MNENNDSTPAADPALDAVEWLADVAETTSAFGVLRREVLNRTATVRDALADRITPAAAVLLRDALRAFVEDNRITPSVAEVFVTLNRIADRETGR